MANKKRISKEGITVKKSNNFSEWYTQIVQKAELADYSPIKGCMIIRPLGYSTWENIRNYFDKRIKRLGVENAYFPLFVPEEFFKKEKEHAKGFSPEVAWIVNKDESGSRLAIRPTSETVMYDAYSNWIRSHRDLPLKINQWANVIRWETKATKLFIRTREFLWQEGHCVYATKKECDKETRLYLEEYKKLCEDILAIPVISGIKTQIEKFAGADYTLSVESLMPDGKALQMGTSHNLGQGFAKSFKINYLGEDEKPHTPWQNSWGVSTRLIGALVMVHGDNKGLVLPPKITPIKGVVIPITFKGKEEKVMNFAKKVTNKLKDIKLDDREEYTPGWKFNEWELKGIPIRIEVGPKDVQKKQVVMVRRDTGKKQSVPFRKIKEVFDKTLENIQKNLFKKAVKFLKDSTITINNKKDFEKAIKNNKLVYCSFCNKEKCEQKIKEKTGATSRCIPFDKKEAKGNCAYCGDKAKINIYFSKSY